MKKILLLSIMMMMPISAANVIVNSSNQLASPNAAQFYQANPPISADINLRSAILLSGFRGPFETGYERGQIGVAYDGVHFSPVPGFQNYNPPTSGDGIRDCCIIKSGNYYLVCSTVSKSGGLQNYFDVARSTDLINWSNAATVTTHNSVPPTVPKWFYDATSDKLYAITGNGLTGLTENTSKDGVTWSSTSIPITFVGGGTLLSANPLLRKFGSTYYLFYNKNSGDTNHVYYATSTSISSGYTEIGLLANSWSAGEGIEVDLDSNGVYHAYYNDRSGGANNELFMHSSTTTLTNASSWSTATPVPGNPVVNIAKTWDIGSGYTVTDAQSLNDIMGAIQQSYLSQGIGLDKSIDAQGNLRLHTADSYTGLGSITAGSNHAITGVGTRFTSQLHIGDTIYAGGQIVTVAVINSDTSITTIEGTTAGFPTNSAFTYYLAGLFSQNSENIFSICGRGQMYLHEGDGAPQIQLQYFTNEPWYIRAGSDGTFGFDIGNYAHPSILQINGGTPALQINGDFTATGELSFDSSQITSDGSGNLSAVTLTINGNAAMSDSVINYPGGTNNLATSGNLLYPNGTTPLTDGSILYTPNGSTLVDGSQVTYSLNQPLTDGASNLLIDRFASASGASSTTFWRGDGTWATPSGGVTSFSSGSLSPLFTTSVATSTTTPALSYSLSAAGSLTIFGNATGSTAAPSYTATTSYMGTTSTKFAAGNDTRFPASVTGIRVGAGAGSSDVAATIGSSLSLSGTTLAFNLANANSWTAKQTITLTTAQERLAYDGSNYTDFAAGSAGNMTLTATGSAPVFTYTGTGNPMFIVKDTGSSNNIICEVTNTAGIYYPGIWFNTASPTVSNYAFLGDTTGAPIFNTPSGQTLRFRVNNSDVETIASTGVTVNAGGVSIATVGNGLTLKSGSNSKVGTGTLSGGTATISNTSVTANSFILVQDTGGGVIANIGALYVASKTASTGFVVTSSNALDTSTFQYVIIESN